MKNKFALCAACCAALLSCNMENPLLVPSKAPFGAPQFDKIKNEHYLPAFKEAIAEAKAEVDAICECQDEPDFSNTIEALEFAGRKLENVSNIFYNLMEADTNPEMQALAEEIAPLTTEFSMYVNLNEKLFSRVDAVYARKDSLDLDGPQKKLLEDCWRGFVRGGAKLSPEDKETLSNLTEQLSLLGIKFSKNVLDATNAFTMQLKDSSELAGLPGFVVDGAAALAAEKGLEGWVIDLSYPSYGPFMQYSTRRDLREKLYKAYNTRAVDGEFDNREIIRQIADLRLKKANLLGYATHADYVLEERMAKNPAKVKAFLDELLTPSLPAARRDVATVAAFAKENGFTGQLQPWDFGFWSEKCKEAGYELKDEELKPYFQLEDCINAVFSLAGRLYGLNFTERSDIPVYHKDVKVYEVSDATGRHMALFYADFFPRESKRGGAWMTEFRGQSIVDGVEYRPFISLVTNFTKPTANTPSLLTHDEFSTLLHEFGHSLHGMLAEGRYPSQTGTSVATDFVEMPSQIMENWAFEPEFLNTFAKHYETGEPMPAELIEKLVKAKNYLAAYYQVRQLQYGILDMAWHSTTEIPTGDVCEFEHKAVERCAVLPTVEGCCMSPAFSHIFAGGYSAGYYSYKWSEVLEADAFSLFEEKGIFNREVADSFRENILSKGSSEDEAVLYRRWRGHDPQPEALLKKLGIWKSKKM
ncbi:MAG: M3 family metallopeptidase [Bacteroidales bacterium]|nr:M3 family metallopeptidase [Bacteroidales bacterium]